MPADPSGKQEPEAERITPSSQGDFTKVAMVVRFLVLETLYEFPGCSRTDAHVCVFRFPLYHLFGTCQRSRWHLSSSSPRLTEFHTMSPILLNQRVSPEDRNADKSPPQAWPCLSHLDDDLALCTSCFDVSHRLFGRFEGKDPIHHWAYDPRLNERTDLA